MSIQTLGVGDAEDFPAGMFGGVELSGPSIPDIPGLGTSSIRGGKEAQMESVGCVAVDVSPQQTPTVPKLVEKAQEMPKKEEKLVKAKKKPGRKPKIDSSIAPVIMPEPSGVVKKKLMILRPTYKLVEDLVAHATLASFDRTSMAYDKQSGDAMIYHSRNLLADRFMKSDFEWALWWDDDIVPPVGNANWSYSHIPNLPRTYPESFLNVYGIPRLLSHGKTLVGGLYYARKAPHVAICERGDVDGLKKAPVDVIIPRSWVGTGFLLTHRSVFEDIQKNFPELAPKKGLVNVWEAVWNYFQPTDMQAEDVSFCYRAKESGHQPYVDCGCVCFHLGTSAYGPWNQKL